MIELKTCPFCGTKPIVNSHDDSFRVICPSCGCSIHPHDSLHDAAIHWNTRTVNSVVNLLKSTINFAKSMLDSL